MRQAKPEAVHILAGQLHRFKTETSFSSSSIWARGSERAERSKPCSLWRLSRYGNAKRRQLLMQAT